MRWDVVRRKIREGLLAPFEEVEIWRPERWWLTVLVAPFALVAAVVAVWVVGIITVVVFDWLGVSLIPAGYSPNKGELGEHAWIAANGVGALVVLWLLGAVVPPIADEWREWRRAVDRLKRERRGIS